MQFQRSLCPLTISLAQSSSSRPRSLGLSATLFTDGLASQVKPQTSRAPTSGFYKKAATSANRGNKVQSISAIDPELYWTPP